MPFFSIVWSSGIPNELVIVQPESWLTRCMSLAEQTYRSHQQHLNDSKCVQFATSHNIRRHFHGFPIISPNKHEQFWGYHPSNRPSWTSLDPLVLPQVLPPPWPKEKMLIWDKQQGDLLEELRKTCEAGGIWIPDPAEQPTRDGFRESALDQAMLEDSLRHV